MDARIIYYNEDSNLYTDECGFAIYNIHREVSPNMVYLFRSKRDDIIVYGVEGDRIELIYLPF